jgi:hypothetical protein
MRPGPRAPRPPGDHPRGRCPRRGSRAPPGVAVPATGCVQPAARPAPWGPKCAPLRGADAGRGLCTAPRGVKAGPPVAPRPGRASLATRRAAAAAPPAPREGSRPSGSPRAPRPQGDHPRGRCSRRGSRAPPGVAVPATGRVQTAARPAPWGAEMRPASGVGCGQGFAHSARGVKAGPPVVSRPGHGPLPPHPRPARGARPSGSPRAPRPPGDHPRRAHEPPLRPRPHRRWCARPRRRRPGHAGCGAP